MSLCNLIHDSGMCEDDSKVTFFQGEAAKNLDFLNLNNKESVDFSPFFKICYRL